MLDDKVEELSQKVHFLKEKSILQELSQKERQKDKKMYNRKGNIKKELV